MVHNEVWPIPKKMNLLIVNAMKVSRNFQPHKRKNLTLLWKVREVRYSAEEYCTLK